MKLAFRQIDAFLKKPDAAALAVLVYGPDEGLVRERAAMLMKHVVSDLKDPFSVADISPDKLRETPSLLLDEAQSISMLGGRKVVRVSLTGLEYDQLRGIEKAITDTLASLKPGDNFIVVEGGDLGKSAKIRTSFEEAKNAAALPCYVEDERDLTRLVSDTLKAQGYMIESDALTYMAANIVGDRAAARGEIEKLITYMGKDSKRVRLDDVTACIGDSADLSIDLLAKNAASGLFAEADRILQKLLHEGVNAVSILRNLQTYFTRLHVTKARIEKGESADVAAKRLKPPLFWKHEQAFLSQVQGWSLPQIEQALSLLMSAEAKCKQTGQEPDTIISRALLAISQTAARGAARRRA